MTGSAFGEDLSGWISAANADPEFVLASRWSDVAVTLVADDEIVAFRILESRIELGHDTNTQAIILQGSKDAWRDFLAAIPSPPNHSILGMDRRRDDFSITGRDLLVRHLRPLTLALDLMRTAMATAMEGVG